MPNQRSKKKSLIGGYYKKSLKRKLQAIAEEKGVPLTDLVGQYIEDGIRRHSDEAHRYPAQSPSIILPDDKA